MDSIVGVLALNAAVILGCMLVLWLLAVRLDDPSLVDAFWPFGFVVVALVSFLATDGDDVRRALLLALSAVWGLRLAVYLFRRWRAHGPDRRYTALLANAPNRKVAMLTKVFGLQGVLMWVVALPLQLGMRTGDPTGLQWLGWIGVALSVVGIAFESIGDAQLSAFKRDPANTGTVMDRGLWRYTRHPNYFGDACHWWGIWCIAVVDGATAFAVVGPVLMNTLLVRWSGAALLERHLNRRPGYAQYVARTSGFIPRPPRPPRAGPETPAG